MTPKQEAALRQAREALQYVYEGANNQGPHTGISWRCASNKVEPVIAAIDEALAEQPAIKPWVGLTTDEMIQVKDRFKLSGVNIAVAFRTIEAKLRELNEHREKNA